MTDKSFSNQNLTTATAESTVVDIIDNKNNEFVRVKNLINIKETKNLPLIK